MKTRKGFRKLAIGTDKYQYAISLGSHQVIVYDSEDKKHILPMNELAVSPGSWRGKNDAGIWGKAQVVELIKHYIIVW